jgi:hypothetical protein
MTTATKHRQIEEFAADLIEAIAGFEANPEELERLAAQFGALGQTSNEFMHRTALAVAVAKGSSTLNAYVPGRHRALAGAALIDVAFGDDRTPVTWCRHRPDQWVSTEASFVLIPLRIGGCGECVAARLAPVDALLAFDRSCDVCGEHSDLLLPMFQSLGSAIVNLFVGACCEELFLYDEPESTVTYTRIGRNEPCPCGSERKFKRCHGAAR